VADVLDLPCIKIYCYSPTIFGKANGEFIYKIVVLFLNFWMHILSSNSDLCKNIIFINVTGFSLNSPS
jgi:hypothetical protein